MLQQSFYLLSAVLVTSTISIMLFFRLPVALAGGDGPARMALDAYAQGLTAFWGTVFTLTLFATFAPAALLLRRSAHRYRDRLNAPQEFQAWLTDHVPVTLEKQIRNLAATLAPLIIGLLGNFLQAAVPL